MKYPTFFVVAAVLIACGDGVHTDESDAPAFDGNAPRVHIVSPERGTFAGDVTHVLVTGTVKDDSGSVASLTVNGVAATITSGGVWRANVPVGPGTNLLHAIAIDARHNEGAETRAIVAGPMRALDGRVADGIRATLSAQALSALGRDTATSIEAGGLLTAMQSMNPVVDVGGGPDCLYASASITSLTVGDADVQLRPTSGGISVSAVLDNVSIGTHLQWAVSCFDGSRDAVQTAQRVTVQGHLTVGVVGGKLDIQFQQTNVQVTGFDPQLANVPDDVIQMLDLDTATSVMLGLVTERVVVPMVDRSLSAFDDTRTIDVAGIPVDLDVKPTAVSFTPYGGTIALDTSFRAHGDEGLFVFVPNIVPTLDATNGFALAVADDAANQLLTSMWSARGFDTTLDLGAASYGPISEHYDSVQLHLVVPPYVEASGNPLELTIGDWIATFKRDGVVAATVAIHARSALYVVVADDGKLRMGISTPTVDLDVVDDAESITKAQYQAIRSFAFARVQTLGSAAVGAIPLPAVGHVTLMTPWVDPRAEYLLIAGDVQGGE